MSDVPVPTHEDIMDLIEQVWGTRSPDLDEFGDEVKPETDDPRWVLDDEKGLWIAVYAATMVGLESWNDIEPELKKKAAQILAKALEHLDEGETPRDVQD